MRTILSFCCWMLIVATWMSASPAPHHAQNGDPFDALPDCGFTADAPTDNLELGAVIYNFETGAGCAENLDTLFPVASVPKLFVAGAYLEWVMQGYANYSTTIPFDERYFMGGGSDCLTERDLGTNISMGRLSELMIACSDNAATAMLIDAIGPGRVQSYIDDLGIEGIGPVRPYADVDRMKLALLDERWSDVPAAMAARYWRRYGSAGLVPDYFPAVPAMSREQRRQANADYFATYDANTATPRALARYMVRLRQDLQFGDSVASNTARALINTMMLTQRQFSTQAMPGTVYTGAKNGYDMGLRAEVNLLFTSLADHNRVPSAMAILFARQPDLSAPDVQPPTFRASGIINDYFAELSPRIAAMLYPQRVEPPLLSSSLKVASVTFERSEVIDSCWTGYSQSGFDPARLRDVETCLNGVTDRVSYNLGDRLAFGLILRGLNQEDMRMTFVYTAPDGTRFSYQTEAFFQEDTGVNWFHPLNQVGTWTIDIYLNLERVWSYLVNVG